jgi:capsular polysaccharide biosynthesis protein
MPRRVLGMGLGMALLLAACAKEADVPRSSEALERSARILAKLDQVEADLHDETSKLVLYGELEQRHGQASQIACQVSDEHVQEIHRLAMAQEKKQAEKVRKRRAVAQARVPRRTATALN